MRTELKNAIILLWPAFPCVAVSILFHSTDAETGGLSGVISSPALMLSSACCALPIAFVAYLAFALSLKGGIAGFLGVAIPAAAICGFGVALLGSTATTQAAFLWSSIGAGLVFLAVLAVAAVPSARAARRCWNFSTE